MSKVTMEFDTYEDGAELRRALNASNAFSALWELKEELREVWKYSEDEEAVKYANHWRDILIKVMENNNINLDRDYF